jgi:ABC-type Na+ efflux pump permease subunit
MKKSRKVLIFLIIIIIIAILGCLAYYFLFSNNSQEEVKIIKSIDDYGYSLNENQTELYQTEFNALDEILSEENVDYEEYAKQVAKMFIIDFYTLSNKVSKNDIGGTEFIKESMRDNFIEEARSTFYKYLEVKSEARNQSLPEVSKIDSVSIENTSFTYEDETTDENAYRITINWSYKEDLGYEDEANMIIVREGNKLYIVEMD